MTTTLTHTLSDSTLMVRRNLIRLRRYPAMIFSVIIMPVVVLAMMNLFFGGAIEAGIGADSPLHGNYINYLLPGILLFVPSFLTVSAAVAVNQDVTDGFINRLRSLGTPATAILAGPVVGAIIQGAIALVFVVAAGFAFGFRTDAGVLDWLAVAGLVLLLMVGLVWVAAPSGYSHPIPKPPAIFRCPSCSSPTSAADWSPPTRCPTVSGSSPSISRSVPSPTRSARC